MNNITIIQLSKMLNQKICIFYKPIREPNIIGELYILKNNNILSLKGYILFNDNEFTINHFNRKSRDRVLKGNLRNLMNEGSIIFI